MVNIRERVFLVSGANFSQRQRVVENIKKRILRNKSLSLNTLIFYSKEIDVKDLELRLLTISFDRSKIAIFKNFHDLSSAAGDFLFHNLTKILANTYLIFETDRDHYQLYKSKKFVKDKFFTSVLKRAALFRTSSLREKFSIENFINSIRRNDLVSSLYILEGLFAAGSKEKILGPQILGILIGEFSYIKDTTEKDKYFKYLWEADRAIKEKGLGARIVIETLLVKLFEHQ